MIHCLENLSFTAPAALATEAHSSRSDRYSHVTTSDIVGTLESDGWNLDQSEQAACRTEGRKAHVKHLLRFSHPSIQSVAGVRPQVVVLNSSDGSSALKLFAGLLRMACMNGILAGEDFASLSVHHRGVNLADQVIAHAATLRSRIPEVIEVIKEWRNTPLDAGTRLDFAKAAAELRFANAKIVDGASEMPHRLDSPAAEGLSPRFVNAQSVLNVRRYADGYDNLWHTFNRVQENLIRGGTQTCALAKDEDGEPTHYKWINSRKVTGITSNRTINQGLWDLSSQLHTALN